VIKPLILAWVAVCSVLSAQGAALTPESMKAAFGDTAGGFVLRDCGGTGEETVCNETLADTPMGPCSTFKIWNSLIGLEEGLINGPDESFWKWDGVVRDFQGWNRDQTWRTAFAASCVPAYQDLARRIGEKRMQSWLDKLGYGNRDMAGRPDGFWLPRAGQRTILITARQQARLVSSLLNGALPVSHASVEKLAEVMQLKATPHGKLYGKTGSGLRASKEGPASSSDFDMGWLVGFVESQGKRYAYACLVLGPGLSGADARRITESLFSAAGVL
jgi:beta-lactamase class D